MIVPGVNGHHRFSYADGKTRRPADELFRVYAGYERMIQNELVRWHLGVEPEFNDVAVPTNLLWLRNADELPSQYSEPPTHCRKPMFNWPVAVIKA